MSPQYHHQRFRGSEYRPVTTRLTTVWTVYYFHKATTTRARAGGWQGRHREVFRIEPYFLFPHTLLDMWFLGIQYIGRAFSSAFRLSSVEERAERYQSWHVTDSTAFMGAMVKE